MRAVCLLFFISSVVLFNASPAGALTNETLYKWCKPWADRAFNPIKAEDMYCMAYVDGALAYARNICSATAEVAKTDRDVAFHRSYFGASMDANAEIITQAYVNKMKNEPERWQYTPNVALREVFSTVSACK